MSTPTETPTPATPSPYALLCGGESVVVTFRDGTTETVIVNLMSLRQLQGYISGIENVSDLVELACKKPKGWADELMPDSALKLDEVARRLNDPTLDRLIERQMVAIQKLKPMMSKLGALTSST